MTGLLATARGRILLPILLLFVFPDPVFARERNEDIYGKWVIKAEIGMGAVTSLSDQQARRIIGKPLLISAEKFEFNGRTCTNPRYERSQEETVSHFDMAWRADVKKDIDIPLPNPIISVDAECNYLYVIGKDRLMIAEENVFFEAVRVNKGSKRALR